MKKSQLPPKSIFFYNFGGDTTWDGVGSSAYKGACLQGGAPPMVQDFSFASVPKLGRLRRQPSDLFPGGLQLVAPKRSILMKLGGKTPEFQAKQGEEWLRSSVQSALCSLIRDDAPRGFWVDKLRKKLERAGRVSFLWAIDLFRKFPDVERVYIPNGRFPNQKAIEIASTILGKEVRFYERGVRNSIFVHDFAPLDISKKTEFLTLRFLESSRPTSLGAGQDEKYSNFARKSSFGSRWKAAETPSFNYVFFTSSQDEFWYLGEDWKSQFTSQFEAIESFIDAALAIDPEARIAIRMHPNTLSKSVRYAWREGRFFLNLARRFPANVKIFWPNSTQDSYQLVRSADRVIVWNSTIGLEALAMDKAVATCAPSEYMNVFQQAQVLVNVPDPLKDLQFLRFRENARQNAVAFLRAQEKLFIPSLEEELKTNRRFIWIFFLRDLLGLVVAISSVVDPMVNRMALAALDLCSRRRGWV